MSERKTHFRSALAGALIGGLIVAGLPVLAAAGDSFVLGQNNNAGSSRSKITSSASAYTLQVKNRSGASALKAIGDNKVVNIKVTSPGGSPIKVVGDAGTAPGLSADEVDGRDANELIRVAGATDTVVEGAVTTILPTVVLDVDITAPTAGWIVATASQSAQAESPVVTSDTYGCAIQLDGGLVDGSSMSAQIDTVDNKSEDCTTTAFIEVAAGPHTIGFQLSGVEDADLDLRGATLWAMFIPFDGTGATSGL